MNDFKATPRQWDELEGWAGHGSTVACVLELRARVMALEAQASNYPAIPDSSAPPPVATVTRDRDETGNYVIVHDTATPPPVATDYELAKTWNTSYVGDSAFNAANRAIYNLGVAHGQARSREVAAPAPVAGGLVERVSDVITSETGSRWASTEARAASFEVAEWLREQGWKEAAIMIEREAGQ